MNCGRLYGHVAWTSRLLQVPHRVPSNLLEPSMLVRNFRANRYFQESFYVRIRRGIQHHSIEIARACVRQVECVIAQKIRRCHQLSGYHIQMWNNSAFRMLLNQIWTRFLLRMRQQLARRTRLAICTASATSMFSWEEERIPKDDLTRYGNELDAVACLRKRTPNNVKDSESACHCQENSANHSTCNGHYHDDRVEDPWELFIQQSHLLVWRREVPNHRGEGLYEYKVFGEYDDITAIDFLAVHVDTYFRKEWDTSAIALDVLEKEPQTNSEVIYWEMQWPRMMSNRDYVYKRRYIIDENNKVIVIVNQNTEHPEAPVKPGKQRVKEYWSIIVIKPSSDLCKPGLEFSMTYFDNPGLVFPSAFASWATATGFPDYLNKLHQATLVFAERRMKEEAAAEEARNIREEEERRRRKDNEEPSDSRRAHTPEAWEVILGGGPILNSTDVKPNEDNDKRSSLLKKLMLLVT